MGPRETHTKRNVRKWILEDFGLAYVPRFMTKYRACAPLHMNLEFTKSLENTY